MSVARLAPEIPFPPYSYVTGKFPHPMSDPAGHSFGVPHGKPAALDPDRWRDSREYCFAIDLFNHGFYWESHEVWESLWHAAGRKGTTADFLKALIKLAAAGVKSREGRREGVRRHLHRATELLHAVAAEADHHGTLGGLQFEALIAECNRTLVMSDSELVQPNAFDLFQLRPD